ncbi:MAG: F0F1 ATP synthase subunit B [Candidatus Omnitrophica bacterium]|nr:F0F1 ATP synthase subunit B [Candidatus Omnitrophota bacterium]MBI3022089.1 F0F1 ATP synthase subunit B [Candidatus Omnitrophota bacterium]
MDLLAQLLTTLVGFFLLVVVLGKLFWRPVLRILDQRRAQIEDDLRRAAQTKQEVARLQEEYGRKLAKIHEEARVKIQEAILEGKRVSLEIQEQARAQGRTIIAKSKETIELELAKAKVTLRDQVAGMTLEAVERILRQKLDPKADRQIVDAVLDELEQK